MELPEKCLGGPIGGFYMKFGPDGGCSSGECDEPSRCPSEIDPVRGCGEDLPCSDLGDKLMVALKMHSLNLIIMSRLLLLES